MYRSNVPGTLAAREFKDDIPAAEKKQRLNQIEALQEKIARQINAKLLGQTIEVLVEDRKKEKWQGRTRSGKLVFFSSNADCLGQLVKVKIEQTSPWSLQGKVELK
jgi:tRNA-2-methylthio-N6-dimethylallyladenosine synthase